MIAQHEIAYLNICQWFYPQYLELSQKLESLNLSIKYNGQVHQIKSWGLYHSLIGDLTPLKYKKAISGGHCNFEGLLEAFSSIYTKENLPHGFTQTQLHSLHKKSSFKNSTLFPKSWTPQQCVDAVIDAIQNPKKNRT